jgi:O-antigen/teichoic acid export membrane protein
MSISRRVSWYFFSSVGVPLLGLATLPIFTTRLGPEQFGAFALGSALAAIVSATAASVSVLSLPTELGRRVKEDRNSYITAVLVLAFLASVISCISVFGIYAFASITLKLELLAPMATGLCIVGGLLNGLWAVCVEILTIDGRAKNYAVTTFLQAIANAIAVSTALFVFSDVDYALFWGFVASAFVGVVAAVVLFRNTIRLHNLRSWLPIASRGGLAAVIASLSENGKVALERSYLGALVGMAPLGLFAHAQYYKNASMVVMNALSRGLLPTALQEAHADIPAFIVTLKLWMLVQAFVITVTLMFALFGQEVIAFLTHGKFEDAAQYAVALLLILLLQTAGKPHATLLVSRSRGHIHANLNTISIAIAIAWLLVSVPYFGVWGAISSIFVQVLIHRLAIYRAAHRLHRIPFSDGLVVAGFIAVAACIFVVEEWKLGIAQRMILLALLYLALVWRLKPTLTSLWLSYRNRT